MFREGESWCFIYFDKRQLSMLKPKKYDLSSVILYIWWPRKLNYLVKLKNAYVGRF